jgi:hypothetical protein
MKLKDYRQQSDDYLKGLRSMYIEEADRRLKSVKELRDDIGRITQVLNERESAKARKVQKMRVKR